MGRSDPVELQAASAAGQAGAVPAADRLAAVGPVVDRQAVDIQAAAGPVADRQAVDIQAAAGPVAGTQAGVVAGAGVASALAAEAVPPAAQVGLASACLRSCRRILLHHYNRNRNWDNRP